MPNKVVQTLIDQVAELDKKLTQHLIEGTGVKSDIHWLKWINMGIAALVLFKLVADWIK